MFLRGLLTLMTMSFGLHCFANSEVQDIKKSYLEDIFIWKISDELKLSAKEETQFSEIQRKLNLRKIELNKKISESSAELGQMNSTQVKETKEKLKQHRQLLVDYNKISLDEHDQMLKLLGAEKTAHYIGLKSDLASKIKAVVAGEKPAPIKPDTAKKPLPPPKVVDEK